MLSGKVNHFVIFLVTKNSFQTVFDKLSQKEMEEARTRSNVYETIGPSIFLNRYSNKNPLLTNSIFHQIERL
jgi:hypothetical protein